MAKPKRRLTLEERIARVILVAKLNDVYDAATVRDGIYEFVAKECRKNDLSAEPLSVNVKSWERYLAKRYGASLPVLVDRD